METFLASSESLIRENTDGVVERILADHLFVPRDLAEYDFDLKQVIPYVIIRCRDSYLLLRRTSKQTEKRLHNKYSLGIGGHINPSTDHDGANIIVGGLYRELNEEVRLGGPGRLSFEGIINDESTSVSKVHLGLFHVYEVDSLEYAVRETEKMAGQWVDEAGILEVYGRMETWSQIIFDRYVQGQQEVGGRRSVESG